MNMTFLAASAALFLVAAALLLRPLLRRVAQAPRASRQDLNAAIYRDQLIELERDRASGSLAETDFAQASAELQRRLLADAAVADVAPLPSRPAWRSAIALGLALPLAAAALYAWLGKPAAMQPEAQQAGHEVSPAQIERMVSALAARLEKNPDDIQGWAMLARSYKLMRRFDEAEKAFIHIGAALHSDPVLLTEYADLLATRAGGNLNGKPAALVDEALKLDPENPKALWLAGTAAFNNDDYAGAERFWERLLKLLPPESDDAKSIAAGIAEARAKGGGKPTTEKAPVVTGKSVSGRVSLAPALAKKLQPSDTLFIFARAVDGPRIPLAVLRAHAQDLPLTFTLDDSLAIKPDLKLSGAKQVKVEARISKSGNATPESGDLVGESAVVRPGAKDVKIAIDRTIP